jgi:predicted DNA-binding protein (MmcQ/YjbR family)
MNIEELREFCLALPSVTEDIKWEDNLVFSVAGKMFCLADLKPPLRVSFKVTPDRFAELTERAGIGQAPYFARRMWAMVSDESALGREEWEQCIRGSYELVKEKLPKRVRENIG